MTLPPRPAPSHVPTLTEVIEIPEALPQSEVPVVDQVLVEPVAEALPVSQPSVVAPVPTPPPAEPLHPWVSAPAPAPSVFSAQPMPVVAAPAPVALPATPTPPRLNAGVDEAAMAQRVLNEVQRQIDGMLEYRLREALTPILARTSESLVRELRQELSKTMRDVVSRAVAQEVARQRTRS
ncbi:MAG TPA: hypothetical protein H9903_05250 [Candidatus Aquabacterium excrementipullorum]|nr:hypothetical protein [Candidatus Aquabacterium excrementipullorum]